MVCAPVRSIIPELKLGDYRPYRRTNHALSHFCTMISSVDLAHYGVSHAKDWVSLDCGTKTINSVLVHDCKDCQILFDNRL